ncbi:MAG: hypothetical protein Tsb0014_31320 [Pleurocapsa sp.]
MLILSADEFEQKASSGNNSLEKVYQGNTISSGPTFSLNNRQIAVNYCKRITKKQQNAICILVEDTNFIRVWSGINPQPSPDLNSTLLEPEVIEINDNYPVDAEFVDICKHLLAEYIGPVAQILCKKTIAKNPHLNRRQLVEILAAKIPKAKQVEEFKKILL